jgi:hypothetical protein
MIVKLAQAPNYWGRTFHLTHSHATNVRQLSDAIADSVEREWPSWEAMALPASIVDSQVAYQNHVEVYRGYLADDPQFDTSELQGAVSDYEPPLMDHDRLVTILAYAIKQRFRDTTPAIPRTIVTKSHQMGLDFASSKLAIATRYDLKHSEQASIPPMGTPWRLLLSGPGGGIWIFDQSNVNTEGSVLPWVHTTSQLWELIIQDKLQLDAAICSSRLLIGGSKEARTILRTNLGAFIEWCRQFNASQTSNDETELPAVVPMVKKSGGRRHA